MPRSRCSPIALTLISLIVSWGFLCHAATVNLAWDAVTLDADGSPLSTPPRYRAYYGMAPQSYTTMVDVGLATTVSLGGLTTETTYYFAVTAYNSVVESGYSNEVTVVLDLVPPIDVTPPVLTIRQPVDGATVTRKSTITIQVDASDAQAVVRVEVYVNGDLLCMNGSADYACAWSVPAPPRRTYTLEARAVNQADQWAVSPPVTVTSSQ